MRSYTNATTGKVDSVATALAVTDSVRNKASIDNAAPQVICEWKMNSIVNCRGVNDLSGGDDFYSSMYNRAERKEAQQDKKYAETIANPWRELNNVSIVRAVSNKSTAVLARVNPWNPLYTKFYPASTTEGGLKIWASPKASVATSAAILRSAANKENSARSINIPNPAGANGSHNRIALGVHLDGTGNGWLLLNTKLPLKPTGKKDKFDWYMPGNKVDLLANAALRTGSIPQSFSGALPRTILQTQQNRAVTVYNSEPSDRKVLLQTTKRVTYFNADYYGLFYKGQTISVGTWSSTISENPVSVKIDGLPYVKVTTATALPWTWMRKGGGQAMIIRFPAAIKVAVGAWSVGFANYASGFVRPVGITPIVVSRVTNSTQLQGELNNLAKLGGASVQYTKDIRWVSATPTVTVPANMYLNFTGATMTGTGTTGTYMLSMGSTGHRATGGKTNITIVGGTWNVGGATGTAVGCMNIIGVTDVMVAFATISNFSNAPGIFMRGCIATKITACNITTSVNHATNHNNSAAIAINSYENNKEYNACDIIQINGNTLSSKYGIRSAIFTSGLIGSHKNIKIHNNIITGDIAGVELSDYDQYAIMNNTINIASGKNGINLFTTRTPSIHGYVYANSLLGASAGKHICITGTNSDMMVAKVNCIDNVTDGTFGSGSGGATAVVVYIDYGAFVFIESKPGQTTTTTATAHSAMILSGTTGQTYNQIKYVQPKVQYYTDKSEVTQVRQIGKKLEVWLAEPLESLTVGAYVNFDGIHPSVDGDKKVLRITTDLDGYVRRTKLVLNSNLSQILCKEGTANKATPLPWPVEQNDDLGYAHVVKDVQTNKITIKFDVAYGIPKDAVVQVKHEGIWTNVYTFDYSITGLSNQLELDAEYSAGNNIRALHIYRDSSGTWSTTPSHFDPVSNVNSTPVDAVRLIVGTTVASDQLVSVTEISARMTADISNYVKSFSLDKELGDSSDIAPVGSASTNTGSISLVNETGLFNENNVSGPFYGLFVKNAMVHIYMNYLSGTIYKTKLGTMMTDKWSATGRQGAEIALVDKSIVLQTMKCIDLVIYNSEEKNALPMARSLQSMLDSVGFSNYTFRDLNDLGTLEFMWAKKELTPWEILKEIALSHQMSIYFDEVGKLQIISRGYIYPPKKEILCSATGSGNVINVAYASDLDGIYPSMPVYWAGGAFTSKIDAGATVVAVDKANRKITLFSNSVNGSFTDVMIGFGRKENYSVIGSNIDNDRITDRLRLAPIRRTRTFSVSSNEALPSKVGIPASKLEAKPMCSVIKQQPEFYVNTYQSTAGNAVTLSVYPSEDDNVSIPNAGSQVYVSNVGAGFDGIYTLTGRSQLGSAWLFNYTGTAGLKAVDSDSAGVVGWTTTEAGYKIYGLEVGKKYKFSGMVYIPSANTANYAVTPGSDATTSTTSPGAITTRDKWVPFNVNFIANNTEHTVKYAIVNGTSSDLLYIYDEEAYYNDDSISEGGYDEVMSAELTTLDRAKKVIVTYKPLNRYGSEDGSAGSGVSKASAKALLYKDDSSKILGTFTFLGFSNGRFLFDPSQMNESANLDKVSGTAEKAKNLAGAITHKGLFSYNGVTYKYTGLYAKAAELGSAAKEILIKNDEDYAYVIELNNGVPPTYTGQGELARGYSMDLWNFNDPYDPTKSTYVVPKNLKLAPMVQGKELPADLDGSALAWTTKLKAADHFGAEFSISTIEYSGLGKFKYIQLHVYQDLSEGYQFGFYFNEKGKFAAYATSSVTITPKAAPGTKVHPKTTVTPLKVVTKSDTKDITRDQLLAARQRMEVVVFELDKSRRCFDVYLGRRLLARFLDDTKSVADIKYKSGFWVSTGPGAGVIVSSTYAVENKKGTKRDEWYDPATHNEEVHAAMVAWAEQIRKDETARNNKLPKKQRLSAVKLEARIRALFEKAKKAHAVAWSNEQNLTNYLAASKKTGATIDRKVHDVKE